MEEFRFNYLTGKLDLVEVGFFQGVLPSAPANPQEGWAYINAVDSFLYYYYDGAWQVVGILVPGDSILQENSDLLLLETGERILL
jgi:hypothetical protein